MDTVIVRVDNMVTVDGQSYEVDCSELPEFMHAVRWNGSGGWIEFNADSKGVRHGNVPIVDFTPYNYLVDRWRIKRDEAIRAAKVIEDEGRRLREENARAVAEQEKENEIVRPKVKRTGKMK